MSGLVKSRAVVSMAFALISLGTLGGCAMTPKVKSAEESVGMNHVFSFDRTGLLCKPDRLALFDNRCKEYETESGAGSRVASLLDSALTGMSGDFDSVLFHVHGGLNSGEQGVENALVKTRHLLGQHADRQLPIILTWPSGAVSNYAEHLWGTREGRSASKAWAAMSSPFVFASDVVKSVGQFPMSIYFAAANQKDEITARLPRFGGTGEAHQQFRPVSLSTNAWKEAVSSYCRGPGVTSSDGTCFGGKSFRSVASGARYRWSNYHGGSSTKVADLARKALAPLRLATAGVFHSEAGAQSWAMMKRRAINMSAPVVDFDSRLCASTPCRLYNADGSLRARKSQPLVDAGDLFRILVQSMDERKDARPMWRVNLVGHSMGAMVINKILARETESVDKGLVGDIVYLASADSIENTLAVTSGAVRRRYAQCDRQFSQLDASEQSEACRALAPRVFNHTLNRLPEIQQFQFHGIVPSGSLLVHIDQVFEKPVHPLQRRMGSELNVMAARRAIDRELGDEIGAQFSFIAWDRRPDCLPKTHGEMGRAVFLEQHNRRYSRPDSCPAGG